MKIDKNYELNNDHNNFIKNPVYLQVGQVRQHPRTTRLRTRVPQPLSIPQHPRKDQGLVRQASQFGVGVPQVGDHAAEAGDGNAEEGQRTLCIIQVEQQLKLYADTLKTQVEELEREKIDLL